MSYVVKGLHFNSRGQQRFETPGSGRSFPARIPARRAPGTGKCRRPWRRGTARNAGFLILGRRGFYAVALAVAELPRSSIFPTWFRSPEAEFASVPSHRILTL